jgi:hypothetical protein
MQNPNEITALVAIVMLLLAAWGYRDALFMWKPETGVQWLMRGVAFGATAILFRLVQWDIIVAGFKVFHPEIVPTVRYYGNWMNAVWNLSLAYAAYAVLQGLYLFIPDKDRSGYSAWSAAFYPRHPFPRLIKKDDRNDDA